MFAKIEAVIRRARRRLSRSEWAIRHLGLAPSEGTAEEPGLLMIQIDGLSRTLFEKAVAQGRMPFLRRLIRHNGYRLHSTYPGLPATTPAVQGELFYGVRSAVPAFYYLDRRKREPSAMFTPACAKEREAECAAQAEGLLAGGSSWSNIYTGGAGQHESHFCIASNGLADMWRTGKIRNIFLFSLLQFPALLRIFGLIFVECVAAVRAAIIGIRHGRRPRLEFAMILSRVFIATGLRELIRIGGRIDVTRGLPIVHVNFVGYDEHAHRRGPGSRFALRSLRGIDRAIKGLWREAQKSHRRDYSVWIYSDHGQEHARSFALQFPGGVERIVRETYDELRAPSPASHRATRPTKPEPEGPRAWHRRSRTKTPQYFISSPDQPFVLAAMGPVGHLYFKEPLTDHERERMAERLVQDRGVPGVLLRRTDGEMKWIHARGATRVPQEVPALLKSSHGPEWQTEIARDLPLWIQHPHAGDLVLIGWSPWGDNWTFAPENGSHGGLGPEETRGFALVPPGTPLPPGTDEFIRPSALRQAALHHLGRSSLTAWQAFARHGSHLRLMTYNTHGCGGMDGRVSPRRIGRVIREQMPDVVALQELDLGRRRSRAEDQAAIIARETGMHAVFCPTVTRGEEHYGHALLSHWPIQIVKRARLPEDPNGWWDEPRAAIWARVQVAGQRVNVITTHLGLGVRERELQMRALLGPEWIGGIDDEPVILCGDFNLLPGSVPYRLAATRLRDLQLIGDDVRPVSTFSSLQPLLRIDHMFVSRHFIRDAVRAVRNDLTRVASDHLPLLADLRVADGVDGTATTTSPSAAERTLRAEPAA